MAAISQPKNRRTQHPMPAFLRGMQRLVDPLGLLSVPSKRHHARRTDADALGTDWAKIGDDLWQAVARHDPARRNRK